MNGGDCRQLADDAHLEGEEKGKATAAQEGEMHCSEERKQK